MDQDIESQQTGPGDDMGNVVDNPTGDEAEKTALLPTDFFQGKDLQPGSTCKVRISRVLDGQVEVTYVPHGDDELEGGQAPQGGDEEMEGYMNT
jgi:hypothetical protein